MPGTRAGTGQPVWFRCWRCRQRHGTNEYFGSLSTSNRGRVNRVRVTGRRRNVHRAGIRTSRYSNEYICLDCEHVGWSRHVELERKANPQ